MAAYSIDENLTPVLLSAMHTLFYVSFAGLDIGLGLERAGLGLGLGLGLVTAGLDYNTGPLFLLGYICQVKERSCIWVVNISHCKGLVI